MLKALQDTSYLGFINVIGLLHPFYGVANLFNCIGERAHVTSDIVEEMHRRHGLCTVHLRRITFRVVVEGRTFGMTGPYSAKFVDR